MSRTIDEEIEIREVEAVRGQSLTRRFTDSPTGETGLEVALIEEQQENDKVTERRTDERLRRLYEDVGHGHKEHQTNFYQAEEASKALQKITQDLLADSLSSKTSVWNRRNPAQAAANQILLQSPQTFEELEMVIQRLEKDHLRNQSKVSVQFRKLCNKFDAHKKVLKVFPSQNNYTASICGSLSLILHAAVNHDKITDTITESIADITAKVTQVSKIPIIFEVQSIKELNSGLYAEVFLFYRDVIEWFLKSKPSRFLNSFNEKLLDKYTDSEKRIERHIEDVYRAGYIGSWARQKATETTMLEIRDALIQAREKPPNTFDNDNAGEMMRKMLMSMAQDLYKSPDRPLIEPIRHRVHTVNSISDEKPSEEEPITRYEARQRSHHLEKFSIGSEGASLISRGVLWLPNVDAASKIQEWMSDTSTTSSILLWIESPDVSSELPSSRAAAVTALMAAWHSGLPILSHFCERPRFTELAAGRDVEKVGLIGLVYSLITQLLQFNVGDDSFRISKGHMDALDGSDASWKPAFDLLSRLWRTTPNLSYCIIDGINNLCFGSGAPWCRDLLHLLLEERANAARLHKVLLTTTGQSRVLPDLVPIKNRLYIESVPEQEFNGGQWVEAPNMR